MPVVESRVKNKVLFRFTSEPTNVSKLELVFITVQFHTMHTHKYLYPHLCTPYFTYTYKIISTF